jgi:anti-anti-sigma factor
VLETAPPGNQRRMSLTQSAAPSASMTIAEGDACSAPVPQPDRSATEVGSDACQAAADRHRLEVHVDRVESILVVTPIGDIDIVTGGLFLEALIAAISTGESKLIVDLRQVPFMDSTGPTIFLSAHRALRVIEGELHIVASPRIAEVFQLAWMDKFFQLHNDIGQAVAALRESAN